MYIIDKEDENKQTRKNTKLPKNKSCDDDPERLARTIFVGNLPLSVTRKVIKCEKNQEISKQELTLLVAMYPDAPYFTDLLGLQIESFAIIKVHGLSAKCYTSYFITLLCLMSGNFTCQWRRRHAATQLAIS